MASFKGKHRARSWPNASLPPLRGSGCRRPFFIIGCRAHRQLVPWRWRPLRLHAIFRSATNADQPVCISAQLPLRRSARFTPPSRCEKPEQAAALVPLPHPGPEHGQGPLELQKRRLDIALRSFQRNYSPDKDMPRQGECAASMQVSWLTSEYHGDWHTVRSIVPPFASHI